MGPFERLAQDQDAWRALVGGLCFSRDQKQWWVCLVAMRKMACCRPGGPTSSAGNVYDFYFRFDHFTDAFALASLQLSTSGYDLHTRYILVYLLACNAVFSNLIFFIALLSSCMLYKKAKRQNKNKQTNNQSKKTNNNNNNNKPMWVCRRANISAYSGTKTMITYSYTETIINDIVNINGWIPEIKETFLLLLHEGLISGIPFQLTHWDFEPFLCVFSCTGAGANACARAHTHTRARTHTHTHTLIHTHWYTHTHPHWYTQTYPWAH